MSGASNPADVDRLFGELSNAGDGHAAAIFASGFDCHARLLQFRVRFQ